MIKTPSRTRSLPACSCQPRASHLTTCTDAQKRRKSQVTCACGSPHCTPPRVRSSDCRRDCSRCVLTHLTWATRGGFGHLAEHTTRSPITNSPHVTDDLRERQIKGGDRKASTSVSASRARSRRRTCRGGCDRSPERAHPARGCSLPSTSSPLIDGRFEVSARSGGSVGRLCGSGGRVWSGDRSPSLVCVFSGRLCVVGLWVSLGPETGLFVSRRLFVSICPPGTSARFWDVPGAGAFGGFDSPAGRRALASAAAAARARRAICRAFSAFVCGVTRRAAATARPRRIR